MITTVNQMSSAWFDNKLVRKSFDFFQIKAADIISRASDVLKKGAHAENLGPVRVEEDSRSIYTAASNVLEASKETSQSFVIEGKCELVPGRGGGGSLGISGWECAAGTLEPLTYSRASSAEFCYPILE